VTVDIAQERMKAWASLLDEPVHVEPNRQRPPLDRSWEACQEARSRLGGALVALDRAAVAGWPRNGISREWVACIDEILAIADRACTVARNTLPADGPHDVAQWPVWEGRASI
jgi:hypothetical protein